MVKTCAKRPAAQKRPATVKKDNKITYTFPKSVCPICSKKMFRDPRDFQCNIFGSEDLTKAYNNTKRCSDKSCRTCCRPNFYWIGSQKLNACSFTDLKKTGVYFTSSNTGFTMKYLELCYLRLICARTSPGQEQAVKQIFHAEEESMFWGHSSFRDHLLHALEGYAILRRDPSQTVVQPRLS
jgi:hypothetical protein